MGIDSRVVGYIYPVCWPYIPNMLYLYVQRVVSICPIHSLQYPFFNVIDYEILENNYMLSVLSVDSKRKSGSRQHPSCFETHGRRFETKEIAVAQKSFAPEFSISIYSLPFASGLLKQIMEGITFQSIQPDWKGMKTKGNVTSLEVRFTLAGGQEEKSMIAFNESGKILFVDYFDRLFGDSRYRKSSLAAVLPFRIEGGSIILSARLNDSPRVMSFLLDTGADGMAIRRSLADSIGLKVSHSQEASVVGGRKTVQISADNVLRLSDSLSLKKQNIAIFERVRNGTDGIIGLNLIRKYITEVNLIRKLFRFIPSVIISFRGKDV